MASLTHSFPTTFDFANLFSRRHTTKRNDQSTSAAPPTAARARREFILEMFTKNSDVFASELDVQNMINNFPADSDPG